MGIYLNPGNEQFAVSVNSEQYVDKTELIKYTNSRIGKDRPLICSSRPKKFGKTMAVTMLSAYYSKGCHSEKLFAELKISQNEFFKAHLNKYNVIFLDIQWMYGNALEEMKRNSSMKVVSYIQEQVITELRKEYINLLRGLFKGTPSGAFLKLAYITGILPIKKYGTQSALNNFREHTMVSPRQRLMNLFKMISLHSNLQMM